MNQTEIAAIKEEGASLARQITAEKGRQFACSLISAERLPNPTGRALAFWRGYLNQLVAD